MNKDTKRHREYVSDRKKETEEKRKKKRVRKAATEKVPVTGRMISSFNQAS